MELILDDKQAEADFQKILRQIKSFRYGEVADSMKDKGIAYKMNWGLSVMDMREIASGFEPNHVLALKLWNKKWRETMILATMLDEPAKVTEEQMDFWTKSFENSEIAEHAVANQWVKTRFAFVKALEWCRGKKHIVRYTGLQLMGRLAMADKNAIDEMFEPFFEVLPPLAKDPKLFTVFYRSFNLLGTRSEYLNNKALEFAEALKEKGGENEIKLSVAIIEELTADYITERFKKS